MEFLTRLPRSYTWVDIVGLSLCPLSIRLFANTACLRAPLLLFAHSLAPELVGEWMIKIRWERENHWTIVGSQASWLLRNPTNQPTFPHILWSHNGFIIWRWNTYIWTYVWRSSFYYWTLNETASWWYTFHLIIHLCIGSFLIWLGEREIETSIKRNFDLLICVSSRILHSHTALWARLTKHTDWSTGPLARPFARLLALLTRSLAPHYSLCSRAPLRSLAHSLTQSLSSSWKSVGLYVSISGCFEP